MAHTLRRARGTPIGDDPRSWHPLVKAIRAHDLSRETDISIRERARALRGRIRAGSSPDAELPECFSLVAESCRRRLGLSPFDQQLAAAVVMHQGKLAQVQTGEGKTLAAVFPACLNAMAAWPGRAGCPVHIMTANDYLARRDARWMGPVYEMMGLTAGSIGSASLPAERRDAYRRDVTYLPAREGGFDYLRDGLCLETGDLVQQGHGFALVDEADSILIDEARVPLVIAGASDSDAVDVMRVEAAAGRMRRGVHYQVEPHGRRVTILPEGHRLVERELGVAGIHEEQGAASFARVHAALHAHTLLQRDVDYVVKDGRIALVDGFTGRIADRREWPWGVQAALQAKEGLEVQPEGTVYGSITIQALMGRYEKLAAMTATAVPSAEELFEVYGLGVVVIPTARPCLRVDDPDAVYATIREKSDAVVAHTTRAHAVGRPVLVGTGSVKESEELAGALRAKGVPCSVLNAGNDEREAEIVAAAGQRGAVTISTNMAGRGTDIRLGSDPALSALGGLLVIGTNRHESRRVDDQLRGRAGRQGEPGQSRFHVSLEDPLFVRYGVPAFLPRGCPLSDPRVFREIDRAQSIIEAQNHAIRRTLRKYSRLVELDRRAVRELRDRALLRGILPDRVEAACPSDKLHPRVITAYLALLDAFWADHLLLVEEVREGIDLERFAGREPGLAYLHRVGKAFEEGLEEVEVGLCQACARAADDPGALDLAALGARRPASTWTYQVDDEGPTRAQQLLAGGGIAGAIAAGPFLLLRWAAGFLQRRRGRGADLPAVTRQPPDLPPGPPTREAP